MPMLSDGETDTNRNSLWSQLWKTKVFKKDIMDTPLKRCLTTLDITLLSIGNMAGAGVYILMGPVILTASGPAANISFLLAGVVALLNGLAYSELSARIPRAGSAYTYTYITCGEFVAFIVGWAIILEYILLAASSARSWSGTLDVLLNGTIRLSVENTLGLKPNEIPTWFDYPDFVAFAVTVLFAIMLVSGPRLSVTWNAIVTSINFVLIVLAGGIMFWYNDITNWTEVPGGFFSFGATGILSGTALCFYSFIGLDVATVSSEEAENPSKSMPRAIIFSIITLIVVLILISSALTLFLKWNMINYMAPIPFAFFHHRIMWAAYATGAGSLVGLSGAIFCAMYGLSRVAYAMAADGLIFSSLSKVMKQTQVPIFALLIFAAISAVLALLLRVDVLIESLSLGSLVAYTIVNINVISLRFSTRMFDLTDYDIDLRSQTDEVKATLLKEVGTVRKPFDKLGLHERVPLFWLPTIGAGGVILTATLLALFITNSTYLLHHWFGITLMILFLFGFSFSVFILCIHKQNNAFQSFRMPFVPILPCIAIMMNIILIFKLSSWTWLRFLLWLSIGIIIYFFYGVHHSLMNPENQRILDEQSELLDADNPMSIHETLSQAKRKKPSVAHIEPQYGALDASDSEPESK